MNTAVIDTIKSADPVEKAYHTEYRHQFLSFCTLCCMLKNKKLNLANIFLLLLQEPELRSIFKEMCEIESDYTALKKFLEYDISLHKSKYIKNFLEATNFKLTS